LKLLFIGDIVGNAGRSILKEQLPDIKRQFSIDVCIANGENAAGGRGITYLIAQEIYDCGVDIITLGNHTWARKEIKNFITSDSKIIRPANYPKGVPGKGCTILSMNGTSIGVINLLGRVYMDSIECPFRTAEKEINAIKKQCSIIIVDIHAEATSEKAALAYFLDGKVSAVLGTHTHVQTADEQILKNGTAFISDVGMTGPAEGILGVDKEIVLEKFLTSLPVKFELAEGKGILNAVVLNIDNNTGKCNEITRIQKKINHY